MVIRLRIEKLVCALMFYYRVRSGKLLLFSPLFISGRALNAHPVLNSVI